MSLFVKNFSLSGEVGMPLTGDAMKCNDSNGDSTCPLLGFMFKARMSMMALLY